MRRKSVHIILLMILGLYYNGAPTLWLAYSTFAGTFFAERCVNPTKPCCKGQCQVKAIEEHSGSSSHSEARLQFTSVQPTILSVYYLPEPTREGRTITEKDQFLPMPVSLAGPFHPPRA